MAFTYDFPWACLIVWCQIQVGEIDYLSDRSDDIEIYVRENGLADQILDIGPA